MKSVILIVLILLLIGLVVFLSGCLRKRNINMTLDQLRWKLGSFSDLEKTPVTVIVTNSESSLDFAKAEYKNDFSEEAAQIVNLIHSAQKETGILSKHPVIDFSEQIWITFSDGSRSVYPYYCDLGRNSYIQSGDSIYRSRKLNQYMEKLYAHQLENRQSKNIEFEQIKWKIGSFSDLEKGAIGIAISNSQASLDFTKVGYKEDFSVETDRIVNIQSG
jgi:hypothetical protein